MTDDWETARIYAEAIGRIRGIVEYPDHSDAQRVARIRQALADLEAAFRTRKPAGTMGAGNVADDDKESLVFADESEDFDSGAHCDGLSVGTGQGTPCGDMTEHAPHIMQHNEPTYLPQSGEDCCNHSYGSHNDLVGCAVDGCECDESKATLLARHGA